METKMGNLMQRFFDLMVGERSYQTDRWADGDEASLNRVDDEKNDPRAFAAYIAYHATRWFPGGFPPYDAGVLETFKVQMVKVATTAYAGYIWAERALQRGVSEPLKVGDVVVRKGTGTRATITDMADDGTCAVVQWFDDTSKLHQAVVLAVYLDRLPEPAADA